MRSLNIIFWNRCKIMKVAVLLMLLYSHSNGQANTSRQEYARLLLLKDDTVKVNRLNTLVEVTMVSDPQFAITILKQNIALAEKKYYDLGAAVGYGIYGTILIYQVKLDSALQMIDKAYTLVQNKEGEAYISTQASLQQKYGAVFQQKQLYDTAIQKYQLAADLYKSVGNEQSAIVGLYNISVMYGLLEQPEKALYYARQVYKVADAANTPEFLLRSYIVLSEAFLGTRQYDSVYYYVKKGWALTDTTNQAFMSGKYQQLLGLYFLHGKNDPSTAIRSLNRALNYFDKIYLPYEKALIYQNLANAYFLHSDYAKAIQYGKQAVDIAHPLRLYKLESQALADLATVLEKVGNINASHAYLKAYVSLKDTLDALNNKKIVNELEAKYQSQKKEALLLTQQNTIYKKNVLNYILIAGAALLLLLGLFGYYTYTQKQQIHKQRIQEMEIQQKLSATEAVLIGEEQERSRLAKDLHDGLGGLLSGIKYSFDNIKGNMVMTEESRQAFNRSMDMLDSSINEMRRVAHNMMPEVLVKFGLDTALKDFCSDISKTEILKITYQSFGLGDYKMPQSKAIAIYRIVQELINNVIKHASATTAIVQVFYQSSELSITVEDDGKGFDTALLQTAAGIGWRNIQNRVEFLEGSIDIESIKDKGTSVLIEAMLS